MGDSGRRPVCGVSWEMQPRISALFDSPDRTFNAGATRSRCCPGL